MGCSTRPISRGCGRIGSQVEVPEALTWRNARDARIRDRHGVPLLEGDDRLLRDPDHAPTQPDPDVFEPPGGDPVRRAPPLLPKTAARKTP